MPLARKCPKLMLRRGVNKNGGSGFGVPSHASFYLSSPERHAGDTSMSLSEGACSSVLRAPTRTHRSANTPQASEVTTDTRALKMLTIVGRRLHSQSNGDRTRLRLVHPQVGRRDAAQCIPPHIAPCRATELCMCGVHPCPIRHAIVYMLCLGMRMPRMCSSTKGQHGSASSHADRLPLRLGAE